MDRVLSSLGLPGWFRHAYFEYYAHVRLRFKLASGLGEPWTRDGGIPQGCPWSMMFTVALYLPWCRNLAAQVGHCLVGFRWDLDALAWSRPGSPQLRNLAGTLQHFKDAILDAWRDC